MTWGRVAKSLVHPVETGLVRTLIGNDLKRVFELSGKQLILNARARKNTGQLPGNMTRRSLLRQIALLPQAWQRGAP